MVYLDTSFVTPYYLNETSSAAVASVLQGLGVGQLVLSAWTQTEFASLLARKLRMGELTPSQAQQVMSSFEQDLQTSLLVIEPAGRDFVAASALCLRDPALGLRGPDALHLAVATNHNLPIYTLDKTFIHAATALGHTASDAGVVT